MPNCLSMLFVQPVIIFNFHFHIPPTLNKANFFYPIDINNILKGSWANVTDKFRYENEVI